MNPSNLVPRSARILRWIARIWSTVLFAVLVSRILFPGQYGTTSLAAPDLFLYSLWGIAILGLALAWRWELPGGLLTLLALLVREIAFLVLKGFWTPAFLVVWFFILPPAVLFVLAKRIEKRAMEKGRPES